jgi:hypothetical protein
MIIMRYSFFLVILLILSYHTAFTQKFKGGMQAGFTASQIAGDGISGFNKAGFQVGFFASYPLRSTFSLQMELAFIQKGSAQAENPEIGMTQYLRRLSYVEWPLLLQYQLQKLIAEAGVSADFLTYSFEERDFQQIDQSIADPWRKLSFNTVIGVRYKLYNRLWVTMRSINSINSIRKGSVPLNVKRYGQKFGEFNDVLLFGLAIQY